MASNYLTFNGSTGFVTVPTNSAMNLGTGDFSICFWIKSTWLDFVLIGKYDSSAGYSFESQLIDAINYGLYFVVSNVNGVIVRYIPTSILPISTFCQITVTRASETIKFYVNGINVTSYDEDSSGTGISPDNSSSLIIGNSDGVGGNAYFAGSMGDLRIYKKALTAGEVTTIYNGGTPKRYSVFDAGAAAVAFNIDEGSGTTITDEIGGLVGTFTGGVSWGVTPPAFIESALVSILNSDEDITDIVVSRIYPQTIPQETDFPAIRYNQVSGVRDHTLTDSSNCVNARFQIDCIASTLLAGRELADAVRSKLDNYSGTVGTVTIQCIQLINEIDYYNESVGVDQLTLYGKTQDYYVWYNE